MCVRESVGDKEVSVLDRRDVEGLAESQGPALIRLAYVLTGDGDEAQDLVQSVFVRLLQADLSRVEDLGAYARRAIANEAMSRGRRRARLTALLPRLLTPSFTDPEDSTVASRQQLLGALSRLSSRQRTVLILRYFEDYSDQAIGEVVGCSPGTVRSIAARALAKLRSGLGAESDGDDAPNPPESPEDWRAR